MPRTIHFPFLHRAIKSVNGSKHELSEEEKKTSLGSDGGIWSPRLEGELTSRAVIRKTSQTGRHGRQTGSQADTEGMLGEESDDAGQQQSHLIPPKKLQSKIIFVFPGPLCLHSRVLCIKHLKLQKRYELTGGRE